MMGSLSWATKNFSWQKIEEKHWKKRKNNEMWEISNKNNKHYFTFTIDIE